MPRLLPLGAVLLGLLGLVDFVRQPLVAATTAGEEGILLERDREFDRVTAQKGLEGFLSFIAEDAAFFPANAQIALGKEGARVVWSDALTTPGLSIRWKPLKADLAQSGELGYTYGTFESRGPGADGKTVTRYGKYVTIWKKQLDGTWKVVVDIGTPSPALEADPRR